MEVFEYSHLLVQLEASIQTVTEGLQRQEHKVQYPPEDPRSHFRKAVQEVACLVLLHL